MQIEHKVVKLPVGEFEKEQNVMRLKRSPLTIVRRLKIATFGFLPPVYTEYPTVVDPTWNCELNKTVRAKTPLSISSSSNWLRRYNSINAQRRHLAKPPLRDSSRKCSPIDRDFFPMKNRFKKRKRTNYFLVVKNSFRQRTFILAYPPLVTN